MNFEFFVDLLLSLYYNISYYLTFIKNAKRHFKNIINRRVDEI